MKRGKDDEKIMGPMFPRLHVNDREKGGPRAPPRNKMALYEQLSIPSQRFSPGDVPIKSNSNSNLDPSGSSSQRGGLERNFHFPHRIPPPTSSQPAEPLQPDRQDISASVPHVEKRKKAGDEDDFTVPIFVHSGMGQDHNKIQNVDRENPTLRAAHSGNSKFHDHCDNASKVVRSPCTNNLNEENVGVSMSSAILPTRRKIARTTAETIASRNQDCDDNSVVDLSLFCENDVCLQQEPDTGLQLNADCHDDSISGTDLTREREKGNSLLQRSNSCSREVSSRSRGPEIDLECHGDKTSGLLQLRNGDKSNGISETSMLDSVSAMAISPDDVVGIIGQKHFWKARRAIVNQQRVFAVQVFELHRLIKVQQLMAESPHLLLEDSTYLTAPALMDSPPRKLPSENVTDVPRHVDKRKDDSDKSNHNMESSAENAVGRTSISLVKSSSQPANHGPYLGNPTPVPVAADPKMTPWYFPQPQPQPQPFGHQWLVPVMSPTEGLVYKPYTSPGYMESACGGCGPVPPSPMNCNHVNPAYGVPGTHHYHHHHHQGFGIMPGTPPVGHGYYPPYGMPVMNPAMSGSAVDQMNGFVGSGSNGQSGELPGATSSMQHQSSCNIPAQNNGTMQVTNLQSKDTELQGSTASSPGEKAGTGMVQDSNGIDALSLFPVAPATPEGDLELQEAELPTRVIRVVPHNGRSATASAARIFQSIQEERRNVDAI